MYVCQKLRKQILLAPNLQHEPGGYSNKKTFATKILLFSQLLVIWDSGCYEPISFVLKCTHIPDSNAKAGSCFFKEISGLSPWLHRLNSDTELDLWTTAASDLLGRTDTTSQGKLSVSCVHAAKDIWLW